MRQSALFDSPARETEALPVVVDSYPTSSAAKSAGKISSSNIRIGRNSCISRVKHRNGKFALYRWKLPQKFIKALAAFQVKKGSGLEHGYRQTPSCRRGYPGVGA
jgi:hypothetical protein